MELIIGGVIGAGTGSHGIDGKSVTNFFILIWSFLLSLQKQATRMGSEKTMVFFFLLFFLAPSFTHGFYLFSGLPWKLPNEFKYFVNKTKEVKSEGKQNVMIMGRKTWDSVPAKSRPFKGRINIVLSQSKTARKDSDIPEDVFVVPSLDHALFLLQRGDLKKKVGYIFIIGGAGLYNQSMLHPMCKDILLTKIHHDFDCDIFWDGVDESVFEEDQSYTKEQEEEGVKYAFMRYVRRKDHMEMQYLDLVGEVLDRGIKQSDRTGVGTLSVFGRQMRFDLRKGFPLLTTKKVFWKGIKEELLWFVAGSTHSKALSEKGVHIWDSNGSREFLDKRGLQGYPEGQLGPVYGFQWRHFGAEYEKHDSDYKGKGVDQLADCINQIRFKVFFVIFCAL